MSTVPTWYDLLDVDRTASTEEIRAAWKRAIEGLDPTDRRFRTLSDAAAVLLDPAARREYDEDLPAREAPATVDPVSPPVAEQRPRRTVSAPRVPLVSGRWLAVLGVLAAVAATAAGVSMSHDSAAATVTVANANDSVNVANNNQPLNHDYVTDVEPAGAAALQAAKTAVVPVLSYDYRHMAASKQRAEAYMTDAYRQKYDQLFALLQQNAPNTQTVVRTNPPIDAGVTLVSPDRVQVLVFVDRPTTNKLHRTPIDYQDYVTVTMANVDGSWLIDDMATTPAR